MTLAITREAAFLFITFAVLWTSAWSMPAWEKL